MMYEITFPPCCCVQCIIWSLPAAVLPPLVAIGILSTSQLPHQLNDENDNEKCKAVDTTRKKTTMKTKTIKTTITREKNNNPPASCLTNSMMRILRNIKLPLKNQLLLKNEFQDHVIWQWVHISIQIMPSGLNLSVTPSSKYYRFCSNFNKNLILNLTFVLLSFIFV